MDKKITIIKKLTDFKWINLFNVKYTNAKGNLVDWVFASRKKDPLDYDGVDAVVIVPLIDTPEGRKVVIIKEYRVAISGYEYGFPAGLVEDGFSVEETARKELREETGFVIRDLISRTNKIYTSPGLSDESCVIVFAEVVGNFSTDYQEATEDIESMLMGVEEVRDLLDDPDKKIGSKAWGVLYYYSQIGEIK